MEVEPTNAPTQPRAMKPSIPSPSLPARPATVRGPNLAQPPRQPRNAPAPKQTQPPRTQPIAKQTNNIVKPLSNTLSNLSLLDRISTVPTLSETVKGKAAKLSGSVAFGGHSISLNGSVNSSAPVAMDVTASSSPLPKGKIKKGPRRLAKLEVRKQEMRDGAATAYSLPVPENPFAVQPNGLTNGAPHASSVRPTVIDLDAEMEEYRRSGLMGLSSPR
jgi:hypothetical protein